MLHKLSQLVTVPKSTHALGDTINLLLISFFTALSFAHYFKIFQFTANELNKCNSLLHYVIGYAKCLVANVVQYYQRIFSIDCGKIVD